ncbi:MAG TPA: acetoacetate decarboxylase family protein [Gemmatimonadaceae bacterium]
MLNVLSPRAAGTVECSAGTLDVPVRYRDGSQVLALYRVGLDRVRALLPDDTLEPVTLAGRALAVITAFEYRDTTVGAYNEVAVGFYVRRRGTHVSGVRAMLDPGRARDAGFWVAALPVTSELARAAGAELWGYPKYVTPIDTRFTPKRVRVEIPGELVMEHSSGTGLRVAGLPIVTFTRCGHELLRTHIDVFHRVRLGGARSVRLDITGDGPTADVVRRLGLHETKALSAFRCDAFRTLLPLGTPVPTNHTLHNPHNEV